jgi:phosphoribosylaminoimidazole-succinocarboxamide synthase
MTPDSSRFWQADDYEPGRNQRSLDKQYLRDYLETLDWNKTPPPPKLPDEIINNTSKKYQEILKILTGKSIQDILL